MTDGDEGMAHLIDILEDIRRWVKIIGVQEAMPILKEVLADEDQEREKDLKITYHLTDGSNSTAYISEYISYSSEFVRLRQNEWADLGLLERNQSNEPYAHVISLAEAGIEVPDLPEPEEETEAGGDTTEEENREATEQVTVNSDSNG